MRSFQSPLDAFDYWLNDNPERVFLRQPINRKNIDYTRAEAYKQACGIAAALQELGLKKGDHVALLSKNCAHWFMADLAIMLGGFISIPLYPTLDPESIREILEHSESKAIIVGKLDDYSHQKPGIPKIPTIGVELYGVKEKLSWENLVEKDYPAFTPAIQDPDDLISIMYTSGTTGDPKGVMHKVKSFNRVCSIIFDELKLPFEGKCFSYLPLSHVAERVGIEMGAIYQGSTVSFPESLDTFAEDLSMTQPDLFMGVPRIWQKFQEKILAKMPQKKLDRLTSIPILGGIIKKKIRKKLGLDSAACFSGAAPLAASLQVWYEQLGIDIHQAYGMTEDCILSHANRRGDIVFGSVGKAMPGVDCKLSEEDEVLIQNGCLMEGYYKQPDKTAEMFTSDGYLKTGDMGEYDHDGNLTIVGRIKDQFKTDKGKYVTPMPIEVEFSKNTDIEQICLVGMGISQPMILIVLSEAGRAKNKSDLNESILESINELNPSLKSHEKIAKAVIMKEEWSVDNGLMTPSLKIRRNRIEAIHQDMYPSWFDQKERVVYEAQ